MIMRILSGYFLMIMALNKSTYLNNMKIAYDDKASIIIKLRR